MGSPVQAPAAAPQGERRFAQRRRERIPVVRGISTGGPRHTAAQAEVKRVATEHFPGVERSDAILSVFDHAQIDERQLARPVDWYVEQRPFAEKNAIYVEETLALGERLTRRALGDAGLTPADVDAVVFVSSTGVSTPSLDSFLMQRMGIPADAIRLPLWGLGCAGGAAGLARAADLVRAGYEHVLLLAVEFCSLTFHMGDESKANFIGTAIFADGGAALVLGADEGPGDGGLVRLLHAHSHLVDDSAALTGWDVVDAGFKLRLSAEIPTIMLTRLRPIVDASLAIAGWSLDDLDTIMVHPGGAKVLTGYELALGLDEHALDASRTVLREHGNMSSPTVLFVLAEALRHRPRGRGMVSATGPGFSAEHLLVEFA
ncbi:MAG: hypothetical protein AAGC46_01000 [Solirubrobacteraceae bacterium]|nr:hypothetical protein [Patulibacter sp.]